MLCGEGSSASVIEHFTGARSEQQSFTNGVTELLVEDGATLNHYRLHLEEAAALHIGRVCRLATQATFNSFHLALGSVLKRIDLVVDHAGQGAHCEVNGIYLPKRPQGAHRLPHLYRAPGAQLHQQRDLPRHHRR